MSVAVKEVQTTPNPNAAKFILDRKIAEQSISFFNAAQAAGHPVAARLFEINGVSNVMFLGDFVTIGKRPEANWTRIKSEVVSVLSSADVFAST